MAPTMAKPPSERQAALRILARATRAFAEEGALDADTVRALVPSWRALAPLAHPTAADDHVDAALVAHAHALSPQLLEATQIVAARGAPRTPPRAHAHAPRAVTLVGHTPADALALALSLSLEAAKRAHKLPTVVDELKRAFASPDDARAALDALSRGGDARALTIDATAPSLDGHRLRTLARDRPVYVVTGSGCWRVHDLLSPWVRRLGKKLALLAGADASSRDDDDAYAGVRALYAHEPAVHAERLAVEEREGFVPLGDALVVLPESVPDAGADRRVHEALRQLKKARSIVVLAQDAGALGAVLQALEGHDVRIVGALVSALGTDALVRPARVVDLASGIIVALDNAAGASEGALTSLPSLAFAYDGVAGDAEAFALVQAVLAHGHTRTALVAFPHGDDRSHTRAAIEFLSRMGTPPSEGKPPPRRR